MSITDRTFAKFIHSNVKCKDSGQTKSAYSLTV